MDHHVARGSIARGKHDKRLQATGRKGPRVIRTLHHLWGLDSLSIKEMRQIMDGHLLLGFSIYAMVLLSTTGGTGVLEHPGEPEEPEAASIWRLPLMGLILRLPGFRLLTCAQGLLGASSTKRTGLLTLNLHSCPWTSEPTQFAKSFRSRARSALMNKVDFARRY